MEPFYFTFQANHPYEANLQQVIAENREASKIKMNYLYGAGWQDCFSQSEMNRHLQAGDFHNCLPLPPVYAK